MTLLFASACAGPADPEARAACPSGERPASEPARLAAGRGDAERGRVLFEQECARCHSPRIVDRGSRLFRGYPRLDCGDFIAAQTDGYLHRVIHDGGESVGLDPLMKPFGEQLDAGAIDDLVRYLRTGRAGR